AARRAVGGARVAGVALSAEAPLRDQQRLVFVRQVGDLDELLALLLEDLRADRDLQGDVAARLARAQRAFAVRAAAGLEQLLEPEIEEGVEIGARDQVDAAAVTAVAAIGTAARDELLAAKAHGATAAMAGRDVNLDLVDEHVSAGLKTRPTPAGGSR